MIKKIAIAASISVMISGAAMAADGEAIYKKVCKSCHASGMMGAPKVGDVADWKARLEKGIDKVNEHAIKGFKGDKGFMPPKGGRGSLSDDEVIAAVAYMVENSK